jgi:hypothetical protein
VILCDKYGVNPRFVHTDKDMAEIGASRQTWTESKHQLCWWHLHEAVRRRLKGNLLTTVYHPQRAVHEHPFISTSFKPHGHADPDDTEGPAPGEVYERRHQHGDASTTSISGSDPNSVKIRIPALASQSLDVPEPTAHPAEIRGLEVQEPRAHPTASESPEAPEPMVRPATSRGPELPDPIIRLAASRCPGVREPMACADHPRPLMIRIPALSLKHKTASTTEDGPDEDVTNGRRTFCPMEDRATVVNMMERHLCAHPLIPGYSAPTPEGIKAWAVKQIYEFCFLHDLPNLWAYL